MRIIKGNIFRHCITIVLAYVLVFGMSLNLSVSDEWTMAGLFQGSVGWNGFIAVGLMALCYFALKPILLEQKVAIRRLDVVLSMVIAFCMLLGKSFQEYGSFYMFNANNVQFCKCIAAFFSFAIIATTFVCYIRHFIEQRSFFVPNSKTKGILYQIFDKRPFLIPFFIILLVWLPLLLLFYPGFLMGDTSSQIFMAFNLENKFALQVDRPNPEIWITNQHPVAHTMLIGACMRLGRMIAGSDTIGYFIYTLIQTVSVASSLAYAMSFLTKIKTAYVIRISVMLFYLVHPLFSTYAMLGTKDTIFTAFALVFCVTVAHMVHSDKEQLYGKREVILYFVSMLGCILFRKNAYHMLLVTIPFLVMVLKKNRGILLMSFLVLIAFQSAYTNVFLMKAQIADGSAKDTFSVPFQQTARYIRDYEDEITPEEKAAIEGVLDYNYIRDKYDPMKSDEVKKTYRNERTDEEFVAYVKVWFQMFLKHPMCYVEATIENTYGYYCFLEEPIENWNYTQFSAKEQQKRIAKEGFDVHFCDATEGVRNIVTRLQQMFVHMPLMSNVMQCALYMWITIFIVCEYLKKKRFKEIGLYMPIVLLLAMCLVSPVNGSIYFRYVYPVACILPILIGVSLRYKVIDGDDDKSKY
ncbi:MAG: hypothetical protein IJP29_01810 [Lachnospiraceae bacterium]|nr:hypothetical protein [Lachnospiraceae bacterium]